METGIKLIAKERKEQLTKHGRTVQEDVDCNDDNQLPIAAMLLLEGGITTRLQAPSEWDDDTWKKMVDKPYRERLIIAGALIAAELDRLNAIEKGRKL